MRSKTIHNKKLNVPDYSAAEYALNNIGYYALIGGYKQPFYDKNTRKYLPGTSFDDLLGLYYFDEELRALFFKYITHIEQRMRSLISYSFSQKYSPNETDYLNTSNYNNRPQNNKELNKLIAIIKKNLENQDYEYVRYQRQKYGNVPLWVIMKTMTFGQISKMYSLLTTSLQSKISIQFLGVSEKDLRQYLRVLTHFRNICAHNERLFSYCDRVSIPDTTLHKKLSIPKRGTQYIFGKSDLFSVVISFRYLLPHNEFLEFKKQLVKLIGAVVKRSNILTEKMLLSQMGFPSNWRRITRYKIY